MVAQSGQFAEMIVLIGRGLGLRSARVISYGNAFDLNEADYLEYLAEDPDRKSLRSMSREPNRDDVPGGGAADVKGQAGIVWKGG